MRSTSVRWMKRIVVAFAAVSLCCGGGESGSPTASAEPSGDKRPAAPVDQRKARGPEHGVYSLIDNRLSAHLHRGGGLVVAGGSAGVVKYLRYRKDDKPFALGVDRDGQRVMRLGKTTAAVYVPLTASQAAAGTVRLRVYNPAARTVSLRANGGKDFATLQAPQGWATLAATAPAGALREGENELLLFTSKGAPMEVAWLQLGGAAFGDATPAAYDGKAGALALPQGGGVTYYVWIPERGSLVGDVAGAGCRVAVRAQAHGGATATGTLSGVGGAVDLSAVAGRVARLELAGDGCADARLARAELTVPGAAPTVKRGPPPRYVLFWIMDSLRADRVSIFVPGARPEIPTFEALAKTGAVFTQAYVQGNESRASHASIWSSQYPVRHEMISDKAKLAESWVTIDEIAKRAKLFTSGVSANGYVIARRGFGTAWDAYRNHIHDGGGLTAEDLVKKGLASLDGKHEAPWFLYLGTIDTHVSWRAKEPWLSKYDPKPYDGRWKTIASGADMGKVAGGSLKVTERDIEHIRAIYDSNVSYQDMVLGQVIEQLKAWGVWDQTLLIVTADHGDEQWEHGRVGHGGSLAETLIHVPLLIHYPAGMPGGAIPEGAEVVDILPTFADLMGLEPDPEWQGVSLVPLAHGVGAGYPRMSLASKYEQAHAARIGRWKLRDAGAGAAVVYDLGADYLENDDLAGKAHIPQRMLTDALWLYRAYGEQWRKARWGNPANVTAQLPADLGE